MNDQTTAPRVTPADIEAQIVSEHYFTAGEAVSATSFPMPPGPLDLLTFCVLVLRNGFTVTGESACASPELFSAELGRRIARQHAVDKVWPLLGYELRTKLAAQALQFEEQAESMKRMRENGGEGWSDGSSSDTSLETSESDARPLPEESTVMGWTREQWAIAFDAVEYFGPASAEGAEEVKRQWALRNGNRTPELHTGHPSPDAQEWVRSFAFVVLTGIERS
jgi:hypothetical protein